MMVNDVDDVLGIDGHSIPRDNGDDDVSERDNVICDHL